MSRFILAIVKALGENHSAEYHFHSFGGYASYLAAARTLGYVASSPPELTEAGIALYFDRRLDLLPDTRAIAWRLGDDR